MEDWYLKIYLIIKKNQQHKNEQERRSTQFLPHVKLNNKSTNKINEQQKDKNDYSNILNSRIDDVSVIVIVVWSEKKVKNPPLLFSPHLFCRKMFFCDNLNIIKDNVIFLSFFFFSSRCICKDLRHVIRDLNRITRFLERNVICPRVQNYSYGF